MSDILEWDVEDEEFWESTGKKIAYRNLWISIASLVAAFSVWLYWSVITVQMINLGFPFSKADMLTITAIAGFSGATLRIPNTFFIRIAGSRNTIFLTTALLIIPAAGTGLALQSRSTPLWVFQMLAFASGMGGGAFASSMSNISFFFPKRKQGLALGLNAGLGNAGLSLMQVVIPLVMTFGVFGESGMKLQQNSGTLIGTITKGTTTYIYNASYVWLLLLVPVVILAWRKMDNIRTDQVSPNLDGVAASFGKILMMLGIGFATSVPGIVFILWWPSSLGGAVFIMWPVIAAVLWATVWGLKQLRGEINANLRRQFKIFEHKHTWIMSTMYTMTFGSFIGYTAGFALAIKVVFGFKYGITDGVFGHNVAVDDAPSALTYAWMGPFVGSFIRPFGGWLADRFGGARVTSYVGTVMTISALGVAYYMRQAYRSDDPGQYFLQFLVIFLILFAATGIGSGSTFRSISAIFDKEKAGPVLGWTSAVAAYGAFAVPKVFAGRINAGSPEVALVGFAIFYVVCLGLNWWFYLGPKAEFKNP